MRSPQWARASSFLRFLDHTQRRTTVGRTPLDEWSVRRRDLYLTSHNTYNKHACPRRDFNPHLNSPAALDRAATSIIIATIIVWHIFILFSKRDPNVQKIESDWQTAASSDEAEQLSPPPNLINTIRGHCHQHYSQNTATVSNIARSTRYSLPSICIYMR